MIPRLVITCALLLPANLPAQTATPPNSAPASGEVKLDKVAGLSLDLLSGTLYVADKGKSVIYRVTKSGAITPFAGTGLSGFDGDGKSALDTQLNHPLAV